MIKLSYYLLFILFTVAFIQGFLAIFGVSEALTTLIMNGIVIILFFISLFIILKERKINFFAFSLFILLLIISIISFLLNDVSLLHLLFFIKVFFLPFLFFVALMNISFSNEQGEKVLKFIMILFLLQIPAAIIKTFLIGFQEDYMGTISIEGGSLATIIPLIAIAYLFSYNMYYQDKKKSLLLIPLFIFVAISCSKLGIILYLFVLLILLYFIHERNKFLKFKTFISTIKFLTIGYIILYAFIMMTPRANPDNVVGGSVDFSYALDFADTYTSRENKESRLIGVARKDAPAVVLNLMSQKGIIHIIFGFGPGDIVMSSYLVEYFDPLMQKYHLGYGARTGFIWIIMQIGILGTFVYLLFHILVFRRIYRKYNTSTNIEHKVMLLTAIGVSIIFFIDYFTYSDSLVKQPAVVMTYFYLLYFVLKLENKYSSKNKNI